MNAVLQSFASLGLPRLIALGVATVTCFALIALLAFRVPEEKLALLYADLDLRDSGQIVERLNRAHIPNQVRDGGAQIFVPADQVATSRVLLARDSLPSGGSVGYEIFDRGDGFASNQFQQRMSQLRALEGELGRTIRSINGVRGARVHLVLPTREPFARERQEAQASVMLTTGNAARLDQESIQAIVNLVAAAVPGLRAQNIAITDNHGNLLATVRDQGQSAALQNTETLRRNLETRLARAVEQMLERSLGPGRARAEVTADMDFERVNESQERFDPDGQVARSTQAVTSNSKSTEAPQNVSVQNNLPNADAGNNAAGSQENRQEETTNYEIGKTVRTIVREQAQIRRLSIAVMVDDAEERGPEGAPVWKSRTPEELQRIDRLVKGAVGFDQRRGDQIEVINLRFAPPETVADTPQASILGVPFERPDIMSLARTLVIGLIAVAVLLAVLRPMALRLSSAGALANGAEGLLASPQAGNRPALAGGVGEAGDSQRLLEGGSDVGGAGAADASMSGDDGLVQLANVDGHMRASSIRRLGALVERHPEESLSILRGWLQQEAG
jgi:flagellar M-ring protein FliF